MGNIVEKEWVPWFKKKEKRRIYGDCVFFKRGRMEG